MITGKSADGSTIVAEAPVLEVQDLSKTFVTGSWRRTRVTAVDSVSFTVPRKSVVALVGESGSGKSTIARLVAKLERPTSGRFLLNGEEALQRDRGRATRDYRREVQMIFQDPFGSINPAHTVGYAIERPLIIHGARSRAVTDRVADLLDTVGLQPGRDFASKFPHELSGGQRQRVAIARAPATTPSLILADEPTSMLDVSIRMGVLNLLDELRQTTELAYLYITHDLASARYISDEILVMYRGRIVEGGTTDAVIADAAHPYTRLLLGSVPDPYRSDRLADAGDIDRDRLDVCPWPNLTGTKNECSPEHVRHIIGPNHWIRCSAREPR